ncbi:MAG: fimbrillin family protein [Muribaculaceae bacterium]|nr:fimbrillin family protein [Muribaculaceae bacterium]
MMKHLFIYLLPAISLLAACQADYDEPGMPGANSGEALKITVEEIVNTVSGSDASRSAEVGPLTIFDEGDRIGIIILDENGKILADNVPYKYDGVRWDFDEDNTEGKARIYYDATMYKYIAYYPYTTQADVKIEGNEVATQTRIQSLTSESVDGYFEQLSLFKWRDNQNKEEDFRCCDPMVWSQTYDEGLPSERNIEVKLSHIRNCFVLDPKVKWVLANGETIHYQPRNYEVALVYDTINPQHSMINATELSATDTGFDDFYIYLGDYNNPVYLKFYDGIESSRIDLTYHAKDGSYRYILGDGDEYTFNWEYTYRDGKTYGGKHTIRPNDTLSRSTRYFHDETIDMGDYTDNVKVGDFFCKKNDIGYALPYDAVDLLDPESCIGIVFYSGHFKGSVGGITDNSDYSSTIGSDKCHGYVLALTEARQDTVQWCTGRGGQPIIGATIATGDEGFQGYRYMLKLKGELGDYNATLQDFPAFYACDVYGTTSWHSTLAAPKNAAGWYLPTITQLYNIRSNLTYPERFTFKHKESVMKSLVTVMSMLPKDCAYLKYILPNKSIGWWSCSQSAPGKARFIDLSNGQDQSTTSVLPTYYHRVRACLSF